MDLEVSFPKACDTPLNHDIRIDPSLPPETAVLTPLNRPHFRDPAKSDTSTLLTADVLFWDFLRFTFYKAHFRVGYIWPLFEPLYNTIIGPILPFVSVTLSPISCVLFFSDFGNSSVLRDSYKLSPLGVSSSW